MFTGIVQAVGKITHIGPLDRGLRLHIAGGGLDLADVQPGDSIAVNGVCLTVVERDPAAFAADVSEETLRCTAGLDLPVEVNLEKALRLADRLGGHLVSGHVDGVGFVDRFDRKGECWELDVSVPDPLMKYIAPKGSVTINGVSLTVNSAAANLFSVNLIPHTLEVTTLKNLKLGDRVNLEVDLIARYVEQLMQGAG